MVFNTLTKIILSPIYYLIHHNYFFGFIHKKFVNKFNYKDLSFELNIEDIPVQNYSSYLFKTYEFNDRKLIEKNIARNVVSHFDFNQFFYTYGLTSARPAQTTPTLV